MSIRGDIDLNAMQGYASSFKEVLRCKMLSQEILFRKQVHELHRLYTIQKTLMEDFGWKELDGCNLMKLVSTPSVNNDFLEENHSDDSRFQQRPFDLQLPVDRHVNHVGKDVFGKGKDWDLRKAVEIKHQLCDNNVSFPDEVKLTLSTGWDTRKGGSGSKSYWFDKNTQSMHRVIDLEESTDNLSNKAAKSIPGDRHYLRVPVQSNQVSSNSVKKDLSCGLTLSSSLLDGNESCAGQNSINQGYKEQRGEIASTVMFTKGKPFTSYKEVGFDLNRVQHDDSSYLNDSVAACLSTAGSSCAFNGLMGNFDESTPLIATSCRKPHVINRFDKSSTILEQDDASKPTLMVPDGENGSSKICASIAIFKGISQTEACHIDLESTLGGPLSEICEDLNGEDSNSEGGNLDLPLKFPKRSYADVTMAEVTEMREEDAVFPHPCRNGSSVEDTNSSKSPTSCTLDCIDNDGSIDEKAMPSRTNLDGSNISSQVAETQSGEQDLRSSDTSELKLQYSYKTKEESGVGDVLIQKAAESLLHFSLGNATCDKDCCAKVGSNGVENKRRDRPQYSLDSYESIVLKLREDSVDDYCVSSKPFEVNELDKKDWGIKLRRGRRLKDFQREILPGLASLSRHEICEDINIMETVIRSREYKRMRSKILADGGNCFAPVKSRRSRVNYAGCRYYS
ncbi:hypothetical protein U1Q18_021375 [Sarracenia purpurea var. burkii]